MTREEAIEFLRSPIKCSDKGDERDLREAMDMAIKSLEQESCGDCISRQAAIDGADAIIARDTSGNNDVVKAMTAWKSYVEYLPPVQPEQRTGRWISTETKGVRYAFWCRYKCSLCGELSDRKNFCPNCGAKMQEDEYDK